MPRSRDQPTFDVRMTPSGPKGTSTKRLRTRDWLFGTLEFQAIWTKLGLLKMYSMDVNLERPEAYPPGLVALAVI